MKINGWINRFIALFAVAGLFLTTQVLADDETKLSNIDQLEKALQNFEQSKHETASVAVSPELESFHSLLWRSMALDPGPGILVPVAQVPRSLFAAQLNEELIKKFEELKKKPPAKELRAQFEFDQYIQTAGQILDFRKNRQFPPARAIAKRGTLDHVYEALNKKLIQNNTGDATPPVHVISGAELEQLQGLVKNLKSEQASASKESMKKDVFANGNQFIWYAVAALFGFLIGIAAYRMSPDFFQKFLDHESIAPTATTHTAPGAPKLDYARWLREFEEILTRLKSSQLSHERRIEDVVHNSEKVSQHALALYSDARIKNEANLEFRMATLLREIQHTFEQSQRLQAGDRAQINLMLEHCLKLCDGIENNSILFDRQSLVESPQMRA